MDHGRWTRGAGLLAVVVIGMAALGPGAEAGTRITSGTTSYPSGVHVVPAEFVRPLDDARHPALIYLHGGGYSMFDPVMKRYAAEMASRGFVVIMPLYLEVQHGGYEKWKQMARDAVTYAQSLPSVDPDRIAMAGISMGGQIAMSAASRDPRVKAVAELFTAWPGSLPDEPVADLPPVLSINGTVDPIIPVEAALVIDPILDGLAIPFERRIYRGAGHGFANGGQLNDGVARSAAFFEAHLGPGKSLAAQAKTAGSKATR